MKKLLIVFMLGVFLTACSPQEVKPTEESAAVVYTSQEYPILFADMTKKTPEVFVLGYVVQGKVKETDIFSYSDKELLDYLDDDACTVQSDILVEGTMLTFTDAAGSNFQAATKELLCESESLAETVHVLAKLDSLPSEKAYYFGTPTGVSALVKEVGKEGNRFLVDIDADDMQDVIELSFTQSEDSELADFYEYMIKVTTADKVFSIFGEKEYPCMQDDIAIFLADFEQDGKYELIVFEKALSRFRTLTIYSLTGTVATEIFQYIFDVEP